MPNTVTLTPDTSFTSTERTNLNAWFIAIMQVAYKICGVPQNSVSVTLSKAALPTGCFHAYLPSGTSPTGKIASASISALANLCARACIGTGEIIFAVDNAKIVGEGLYRACEDEIMHQLQGEEYLPSAGYQAGFPAQEFYESLNTQTIGLYGGDLTKCLPALLAVRVEQASVVFGKVLFEGPRDGDVELLASAQAYALAHAGDINPPTFLTSIAAVQSTVQSLSTNTWFGLQQILNMAPPLTGSGGYRLVPNELKMTVMHLNSATGAETASASVVVTRVLKDASGATVSTTTATTDASGVATFAALPVGSSQRYSAAYTATVAGNALAKTQYIAQDPAADTNGVMRGAVLNALTGTFTGTVGNPDGSVTVAVSGSVANGLFEVPTTYESSFGYKATLAFTCGTQHANRVINVLTSWGYSAEVTVS